MIHGKQHNIKSFPPKLSALGSQKQTDINRPHPKAADIRWPKYPATAEHMSPAARKYGSTVPNNGMSSSFDAHFQIRYQLLNKPEMNKNNFP